MVLVWGKIRHHQTNMLHAEENQLLKKPEVAAQLAVSVRSINNLIRQKALEVIRFNGAVRFSPAAVERFKRAHTIEAKP